MRGAVGDGEVVIEEKKHVYSEDGENFVKG